MYQTPKFAGAVRYNAPKGCATRLCRACVELTVCVAVRYPITANISRNKRNCNPTAVPLFRSGHMLVICARLSKQGKGRSSKRKGNRRCPFLFAPAVGTAAPAHSAERNFPRFQLTTARKSGIIDTQYRKCDEETSFPSAVLQREDIRCKSLSGAENSHFRAVCN